MPTATRTHVALGRALHSRATHEGLTAAQVAERAELPHATVTGLFGGEAAPWETVERVARALRTNISPGLEKELRRMS